MRIRSRVAVVVALVLAFSVVGLPGLLVQGVPSNLYPVTVTLSTGETVFIASHTSDLAGGNWIELGGGTSVKLPSGTLAYEGLESATYVRDGVTVTIESSFAAGEATYPLGLHYVYSSGQDITAKFWGASALVGKEVDFKLFKLTSITEVKDIFTEIFQGNLDPLRDKLSIPTWEESKVLDPSGDAEVTIPKKAVGNYLLAVVKEDGSDIYVYSATVIEVLSKTLVVTCPSSVKKGDPLNVETGEGGINGAVLIKESAYTGEIKLVSDNSVLSTEIYLNDVKMADGLFVIDSMHLSIWDLIYKVSQLEGQLINAFGSNQIAISYGSGSLSIPTGSLTPGDYVLLAGVVDYPSLSIVGVYQKTVTVTKPYVPGPSPGPAPSNRKPVADAGPNQKISMGSTLYLSGADSYDPDGTIKSYDWDFGDGNTATGETTSNIYSEPGIYVVTLTVKDNSFAEDVDKCTVMVWEWPAPVADKFGTLVPGEQRGFKIDATEAANTAVTLNTTKPVTFTVLRYEHNPYPDDPMPDNALPIYVDIEASNSTAIEWPIYVEVHYTDEEAEGLDESLLGIYYWKDAAWHRCSHTGVDTEMNIAWAYMTEEEASGSPILVGSTLPKPAEFILSNLSITPEQVELGEKVTISVLVTNVGEETGSHKFTIDVEGKLFPLEVTLEGGESETVTLTYTTEAEGTYQVEVDGLTGSFEFKILPFKPAEFKVSDLTVSPGEVDEGDPVTVTVKVTNIGEQMGSHTVTLKLDGIEAQTAETTLIGGASTTITFTLTEAAGEYTVTVDGLTTSFTVKAPIKKPPYMLYIGILVLIIAAGAYIYIRSRG